MVTEEDIKKVLSGYSTDIQSETKGEKANMGFLTVTDIKQKQPEIVIHFIDSRIYSITFLNNEFFEIPDQDLLQVLSAILAGGYKVHKPIFGQKKSIFIESGDKKLTPTRVNGYEDKGIYNQLPFSFSRK
jgi:hypothetical protein